MRLWGKEQISEQQLIEGCIRGDRRMQEAFYKVFAPRLFPICLRYAGDYYQAEDMMQEGFVRAYANLHKFRNEGSFEGWMKRIFVNTAIEGYRKNQVTNNMLEVEDMKNDLVQEDDFHHLSASDLIKMIQHLSPGYRTVFNLYAIEGYSHQEIAEMLSINIGTSKSQLARARYLLQKMVLNSQRTQKYAAIF